jgi:hypothetical protein
VKIFPTTIKDMQSESTMRLIRACILDEREGCTNVYSPKYKELSKLYYWVSKNIPDERLHDKEAKI